MTNRILVTVTVLVAGAGVTMTRQIAGEPHRDDELAKMVDDAYDVGEAIGSKCADLPEFGVKVAWHWEDANEMEERMVFDRGGVLVLGEIMAAIGTARQIIRESRRVEEVAST